MSLYRLFFKNIEGRTLAFKFMVFTFTWPMNRSEIILLTQPNLVVLLLLGGLLRRLY